MTTVTLQFTTLADLAAFFKQVCTNRGYRIVTRHLTLRCQLSEEEQALAREHFGAIVLEMAA